VLIHTLLLYVVYANVLVIVLEIRYRHSVIVALARAYTVLLQGTWFWQVRQFNVEIATNTHTHPFNGPLSGTTRVSRYQKGKTNRDFTEGRNSEWQWHQLGYMQVCTSLVIPSNQDR